MKELIQHTGFYSVIRFDYVQICSGDVCAAQLLSSFEKMTLLRMELGDSDTWLYISTNDLVKSLCGTFKRNKVIESLKTLRVKGFIESKSSSDRMDKTLLYKFNTEVVQTALDKHFPAGGVA